MARKARQSPQDESTPRLPMPVTSIRIPPWMRDGLAQRAKDEGTTFNQQIVWAIAEFLSTKPRRR